MDESKKPVEVHGALPPEIREAFLSAGIPREVIEVEARKLLNTPEGLVMLMKYGMPKVVIRLFKIIDAGEDKDAIAAAKIIFERGYGTPANNTSHNDTSVDNTAVQERLKRLQNRNDKVIDVDDSKGKDSNRQ